ncbi:MAG: HD domain-containing protein [bacterium]|nr:HD domain-containing protein [bacterium]MDT8395533.1 HD domain-containing protein [bacterium]
MSTPMLMEILKRKSLRVDLAPGFRDPLTELVRDVAPFAKRLGLRVLLVGGTVRDLVVHGCFSGEWDLVVFGDGDGDGDGAGKLAEEMARTWKWREPVSFPRFGTHLVIGKGCRVELSQARLRTKLRDLDPDPLTSDALSRDFTLNALYVDLTGMGPKGPGPIRSPLDSPFHSVDVLDPTGRGIADLHDGILKTPLPGKITFVEDPLRVFRAARFKAVNGYRLDPAIGRAVGAAIHRLPEIAPERIREELDRILLSREPSLGLEPLGRWSAFSSVAPEIQAMVGFVQDTPWHFPDLFRHTLRVVDRCPPDVGLRWAALLHDCGKPLTRVHAEGGDIYHGHESVGADAAGNVLKRLKCSRHRVKEVQSLVRLHMVHYQDEWSDRAVGRFIRRSGSHLDKLLDLVESDSLALRRRRGKLEELGRLRERIASIRERLPAPASPLDGRKIMELLNLETGALVGRAKEAAAEAVGDGRIPPDEDAARAFLLEWFAQVEMSGRS